MKLEFKYDLSGMREMARKAPGRFQRFMAQLGMAVRAEAVDQLSRGVNRAEKTGNLGGTIGTRTIGSGKDTVAEVCATQPYARFIHEGTGIFGPLKRPIVPTHAKALAFKIGGQTIIRRSVKGMRPRPFFTAAIRKIIPSQLGRIFNKVFATP